MGMLVNKKQLAEVFGISERSFTEYQRDPSFPIRVNAGRGRSNEYDTADVYEWLQSRTADKTRESAKERLDRLRGDREELNLAKDAGELIPADELSQMLTDVVIAIRNTQMHGNGKLKKRIDRAHQIDLDIEILNDYSREVLTHLSTVGEFIAAESSGVSGEVRSA